MSTAWLAEPLVAMAWCWRIVRSDGATLGFTTHDAPLTIDNLVYSPSPGMRPSAIVQRDGLDGDTVDIDGALHADAITAADLATGRWDDAELSLFVVDWSDGGATPVAVTRGRIGSVWSDGRAFTAELSARDPSLDEAIVPETSAECRAELGDAACRVAMAGRRHRATVTAVDGDQLTISGSWDAGQFAFGQVRLLSGPARGITMPVISNAGSVVEAAVPPAIAIDVGARVELIEGCDKSAATCAARYANIANFRGEPHLPGLDLLTRFPGG